MKQALHNIIETLDGDELEILHSLATRLARGRELYGEWKLREDDRNYPTEMLEELLDALHYGTAWLLSQQSGEKK